MINSIKIIQHNVLNWTPARANELYNYYSSINPDVILLNSTCTPNNKNIKLFNYICYQKNFRNENHAGICIAVKQNLEHKILDTFLGDTLAVEMQTSFGP